LISESRRKDDRLDEQTPARLARIDPQLLCPVKHRSAKAQAGLRSHPGASCPGESADIAGECSTLLAKSYCERGCVLQCTQDGSGQGGRVEPGTAVGTGTNAGGNRSMSERIFEYEEQSRLARERYPQAAVLTQIKGVGTLIALTFMLTIEDAYPSTKALMLAAIWD
jgi:hypothetical protein